MVFCQTMRKCSLLLLLLTNLAHAQGMVVPPNTGGSARRGEEPSAAEKTTHDKLDFNGRVRMGATYDSSTLRNGSTDITQKGLALALVEARLGARYDVYEWLSLTLEADFAGKPTLKDGFVRLDSEGVRGQFGQFKMPVSAIAQESPWSLPLADRGIIHHGPGGA